MKKIVIQALAGSILLLCSCKRTLEPVDPLMSGDKKEVITQEVSEYGLIISLDYTGKSLDSTGISVSDNFSIRHYNWVYDSKLKVGNYSLMCNRRNNSDKDTYYIFGVVDFSNTSSSKNKITYFKKFVEIF